WQVWDISSDHGLF
nr:immunoglobulin light chain junction region [Macaca mulatta]